MQTEAEPQQVRVEFTLAVNGRGMRAGVDVPARPVTTAALLPILQELSNTVVTATVEQAVTERGPVSCQAGCGACCRQMVPLTLFEADLLATWIRSLPADQQAALAARFDRAVGALASAGMLERLHPQNLPGADTAAHLQMALDYLQLRVPCPFLQNESCGIYPIRPLICREYLVTSPPVFCENPTHDTVRPVPMPIQFSRSLHRLGSELTGGGPGWLPLTLLFAWIRTGTTLEGAPALPGPQMLQSVLEHLANDAPVAPPA